MDKVRGVIISSLPVLHWYYQRVLLTLSPRAEGRLHRSSKYKIQNPAELSGKRKYPKHGCLKLRMKDVIKEMIRRYTSIPSTNPEKFLLSGSGVDMINTSISRVEDRPAGACPEPWLPHGETIVPTQALPFSRRILTSAVLDECGEKRQQQRSGSEHYLHGYFPLELWEEWVQCKARVSLTATVHSHLKWADYEPVPSGGYSGNHRLNQALLISTAHQGTRQQQWCSALEPVFTPGGFKEDGSVPEGSAEQTCSAPEHQGRGIPMEQAHTFINPSAPDRNRAPHRREAGRRWRRRRRGTEQDILLSREQRKSVT
ncbi:unnamed protein product [Pleuronectes platessa]|uniref:Uncharacterized protein n=1 Tax=Pleuronectes platessa TaxID=8262 RepID=A0A9N7Y2G0_PLEPL|nr:unnamed protein product [Pleuronectes platessa]